jgi:bifunctional non-homologous end joining protein LigD
MTRLLPTWFVEPCLPSLSDKPRIGPQWLHEIKRDGYRMMARFYGEHMRLFTRRGHDWSDRYPRIIEAMRVLKASSALIDGEAVWCVGNLGTTDFEKLQSRAHDREVVLYAFDLLELDGEDLRDRPLEERKVKLAKLIARSDGLQFSNPREGDGAEIFKHICEMGLEGIVSKRRDSLYVSGRTKSWIEVRNPARVTMRRYEEGTG